MRQIRNVYVESDLTQLNGDWVKLQMNTGDKKMEGKWHKHTRTHTHNLRCSDAPWVLKCQAERLII